MSEQQPTESGAESPDTDDQPTDDQPTADRDTSSPDKNSPASKTDTDQNLDPGEPGDVGDAELPEDLKPAEDNPLARHPGQTGLEDDEIGADREEEPETAPLTQDDADYGSGAAG